MPKSEAKYVAVELTMCDGSTGSSSRFFYLDEGEDYDRDKVLREWAAVLGNALEDAGWLERWFIAKLLRSVAERTPVDEWNAFGGHMNDLLALADRMDDFLEAKQKELTDAQE